MTTYLASKTSTVNTGSDQAWIKWGLVAVASVLAGGLATAWWYRTTLNRLRQPDESGANPHFGISGEDRTDEV